MPRFQSILILVLAAPISAQSQPTFQPEIKPASNAAREALRALQPAPGLVAELVAAEPDLANPVAFDITPDGRIFVAETYRLRRGVFDTRDHDDWVDEDLAARTVADRVAMMEKRLAANLDEYRVAHERIRLLRDLDGDGTFESTVFADGFKDLAQGIASGVLVHGDDVWFTCIPELWRLRDNDGDGVADQREAIHTGFGVRFNLIGHDLHGLRVGPDRRLYFSIGDRGLSVETDAGKLDYPDTGAVLRCELDGSKLEVFAFGLRNPQELAFDAHGNLFTGDNNSDGGDQARWVYVIEGGDSGWRVGYQWRGDRGPWNRENLWRPHHPEQPAWIVPPIANVASGPSGLTFYPGTGLPARYDGCFFLCDFRANPTISGIHTVRAVPKGAGFELAQLESFLWGVCATDVEIGFDGGVYLSDWVSGWGQPLRGRIYRVHDAAVSNSAQVHETRELLRAGMTERDVAELCALLRHADQRVRLAAQFALVDRGATAEFARIALAPDDRLARLHAIWGIGVLARNHAAACEVIQALLDDGDAEIVAQTAKVIGEARFREARAALVKATTHVNSRARFFAVQALGKTGDTDDIEAIAAVLRANADRDPWLRHAAAMALAAIGDTGALRPYGADESAAVRRGVLLAFIRLGSDDAAMFLDDPDRSLVLEAARAAYRMPQGFSVLTALLSELITRPGIDDFELGLRVLNANRRLASRNSARALAAFAARESALPELRVEALEILGEWADPSPRDRVIGGIRPIPRPQDPNPLGGIPGMRVDRLAGDARLIEVLPRILERSRGAIATTAARIAGARKLANTAAPLAAIVKDREREAATRAAALTALGQIEHGDLAALLDDVDAEDPVELRLVAVRLLAEQQPDKAVPILASLCENATRPERQNAMKALGASKSGAADAVVRRWLDRLASNSVPADMQLELFDAATARFDGGVLTAYAAKPQADDPLAQFRVALEGGDTKRGRKTFFEHAAAQCLRCHSIGGEGGDAGPVLDKIGTRATREHLLESLISPNAKIAEGFAMEVVTLRDDSIQAGVLRGESDATLELVDAANQRVSIAKSDIKERESRGVSSMPPMHGILTLSEMRDVIEFLATTK